MQFTHGLKNKFLAIMICIVVLFVNFNVYADSNPNIAEGKKVYSLGDSWWNANLAVDGVETNNNSTDTWLSKVQYSALYIDLENVFDISKIELVFPGQLPNTTGEYLTLGTTQFSIETVEGLTGTPTGSALIINEADRSDILNNGYLNSVYPLTTVTKSNTQNNTFTINASQLKTRYLRIRMYNFGTNAVNCAGLTELKMNGTLSTTNEKPNIATGKSVYSLGENWWSASQAIDGQTGNWYPEKDTWLSKYQYSALYFDLSVVYEISKLELFFPKRSKNFNTTNGYLDNGTIQCDVETVESLPGTVSGEVINVSDRTDTLLNGYKTNVWSGQANFINAPNNKLSIDLTNVKTRYLRVRISNSQQAAALSEIKIYGEVYADPDKSVLLKSISANGTPLTDFDVAKNEFEYILPLNATEIPEITAEPLIGGETVSITQGDMTTRKAVITVISKDGSATATYSVNFVSQILVSRGKYSLAYVSAYEPTKNTLDGDATTKWKAFSGWGCMFVDLGAYYDLSAFTLNFGDVADGAWNYKVDSMSEMPQMKSEGATVDNQEYLGDKYVTENLFEGKSETIDAQVTITGNARYVRLLISNNTNYTSKEKLCVVNDFDVYAKEAPFDARLKNIEIGGTALSGFSSEKYGYFVEVQNGEKPKTVTALPITAGATVAITQADDVPGKAEIICVSKDKTKTLTYAVFFVPAYGETIKLLTEQKKPIAYQNPENSAPGYAFDGDERTVWDSGNETTALFIDLKGLYKIKGMHISFASGNTENYNFKIDKLSALPEYTRSKTEDFGNSLVTETIYDGSSQNIQGDDIFLLTNSSARFVRILIKDSTVNVGIKEFFIYGTDVGTNSTELSSIEVDGKPIAEFNKNLNNYFYPLPKGTLNIPVITAQKADANSIVKITQAKSIHDTAKIEITSSDLSKSIVYTIYFREMKFPQEKIISQGKAVSVTSSLVGSNASNLTDGNFGTVWQSENTGVFPAVTIDLGKNYFITSMNSILQKLSFRDVVSYAVFTSSDGVNYTRAYSSDSDIYKGGNLFANIGKVARYVKVTYFGIHGYRYEPLNISELVLYGAEQDELITSITADGKTLQNFVENITEYTYSYDASNGKIPNFAVLATEGTTVEVIGANKLDGNVIINVTKGQTKVQYTIVLCPSKVSLKGKRYYLQYKDFMVNDK